MKRLLVLISMLIAGCGDEPIQTPDWRLVATSANDEPYCVDINSTTDSGFISDNKLAWVKLSRKDGSQDNPSYVDVLAYTQFNCGERTTREHSWIKRGDDVTQSGDVAKEEQSDSPIVPDTIGATMYNAICHGDLEDLSACPRDLFDVIDGSQSEEAKPQVSWEELSPTPPSDPFADVLGPSTPSEEANYARE